MEKAQKGSQRQWKMEGFSGGRGPGKWKEGKRGRGGNTERGIWKDLKQQNKKEGKRGEVKN